MDLQQFYINVFKKYPLAITDTRNIIPDSIFFALKGANFNGNEFAIEALRNGAAYAVVDEAIDHEKVIVVDDVLSFLQKLANYHRKQFAFPFIGITGTNGKTTTKELVATVLSTKYKVAYTKGNFNNHIGVPLTILSIPKNTEIAVIEMGANHPGEIEQLCNIAEPDFGIITNVGKAHLEGFGSFENVIATKTEMYRNVNSREGVVFVDADNKYLEKHVRDVKHISYSFKPSDSNVWAENLLGNVCASFNLHIGNESVMVESNLFGEYNTKNMLAASCIGNYFGIHISEIKIALESYMPSNNRSQIKKTSSNVLILDAYNANPTSMNASISHFNTIQNNSKVLILGEMFELGKDHESEHHKIIELLEKTQASKVFFIGNWPQTFNTKFLHFSHANELLEYMKNHPIRNSLILIKGSRGVKLETVVGAL